MKPAMESTFGLGNEVRRQSLPEQVAVAILEALIDQRLKPGDALPSSSELSEQFGVSRTVVREAIAYLMGRGVVSRSLSKEPVISMPGPDQLREVLRVRISQDSITIDALVELRLPLEIEAARLAAIRRSAEQLVAIEAEFAILASEENEEKLYQADIGFHRAIAVASRNLLFPLVLDSLAGLLHEFRRNWYAAQRAEGKLPELVDEHRRVLDAIRASDPDRAAEAMSGHLLTGLAKIHSNEMVR